MIFAAPVCLDIPGITNIPVTILSSTTYTLVINSLTLCNTFNNDIRINLKRLVTTSTPISNVYKIKDKVLQMGSSIDLIEYLGNELYLPVAINQTGGNLTSSLSCYTTSVNQTMDCSIDYTILYETGA